MLTREALAAEVAARTGDDALAEELEGGFGDLLKPAAFAGELCFAPSDGRLVGFTRPVTWLARGRRRILRRPRRGRAALPVGLAEAGRLAPGARRRACGGRCRGSAGWLPAVDAEEAAAAAPEAVVRLLPAFDEYVRRGAARAEAALSGAFRDRVYRAQGRLSPVLLVDGGAPRRVPRRGALAALGVTVRCPR